MNEAIRMQQLSMYPLDEKTIGKAVGDIHVVIDLDKTAHAGDRQTRHGEEQVISDDEIIKTTKRALPKLSQMLILGTLDIGDDVVIQAGGGLNIVGNIKRDGQHLKMVVITVMRKKNFKPKSGTTPINV